MSLPQHYNYQICLCLRSNDPMAMAFIPKQCDTDVVWTHVNIATEVIILTELSLTMSYEGLSFLEFWLVFMIFQAIFLIPDKLYPPPINVVRCAIFSYIRTVGLHAFHIKNSVSQINLSIHTLFHKSTVFHINKGPLRRG